jgi:hypothetical protein
MSKRDPWTGRAIPVVFLGPRRGFALPFLSLPGEPPNPPAPNRSQSSRSPPIHPTPTIITHPPSPGPASLSPPSPSSSSAFYYSSPLISFWLLLVGSLLASCENPPPRRRHTHTHREARDGEGEDASRSGRATSGAGGARTHARDSPEIQDPRDPLAPVASQSPERIRVHGGRRGARRVL